MQKENQYCNSLYAYSRFKTIEVNVGGIGFGGENPIRVQSMTTTDTMDTEASVEQCISLIEAGCELVRLTAPSKRDAENLKEIKRILKERGYDAPLVADIHFTPNAAEVAADHIEKVRVNPGNYADKKKFESHDYSDEQYTDELIRIREKFTPLVFKCKANKVAIRIGTNHGSLSDRILSRYGDTPLGMVESAMEFIRICADNNFHDLVISMKASNPQVMVQAYRLLVNHMMAAGMNYPLHLGVTEAGEGEDGRIKSAIGIGALLEDGIGDTIRVSLTEEPEAEIPVARSLLKRYENRGGEKIEYVPLAFNPFEYTRHHGAEIGTIGGKNVPRVIADYSNFEEITPSKLYGIGYRYDAATDKWNLNDQACDFIYTGKKSVDFNLPGTLSVITDAAFWDIKSKKNTYPLFSCSNYFDEKNIHPIMNFVLFSITDLDAKTLVRIANDPTIVIVLTTNNEHGMAEQRAAYSKLINNNIESPVVLKRTYENISDDDFQLYSSTDLGALLLDGMGDGIMISSPNNSPQLINKTAFGILQATRLRISKTEYISCPSCGRTLFDLQETTAKIRKETDHLKGLKIGVMGCIVNGPGEMADADYGYVGTGPGKITLYKEKEVVEKNVPEDKAVQALVNLIKSHGDWVEPA